MGNLAFVMKFIKIKFNLNKTPFILITLIILNLTLIQVCSLNKKIELEEWLEYDNDNENVSQSKNESEKENASQSQNNLTNQNINLKFEEYIKTIALKSCQKFLTCEESDLITFPKTYREKFNIDNCYKKLTFRLKEKLNKYTPKIRNLTSVCYVNMLKQDCQKYWDQSFQYPACIKLHDEIRKISPIKK